MVMKEKPETVNIDTGELIAPESCLWSFSAVAALHFIGLFLPANYSWGYNFWSVLGKPLSFLFPLVVFVLLTPAVVNRLAAAGAKLLIPLVEFLKKLPRGVSAVAATVLLLLAFYGLRSEALIYGDGFIRLANCSEKILPDFSGKALLEIGSILLPHYFYVVLEPLGWKAGQAFALSSVIGGLAGFWALYKIAAILAGSKFTKWFLLFGMLSSGAVILFFGYIENYTWATAVALWSLYQIFRYFRGDGRIWPALALAVLAVFIHVVTLPFLAAVFIAPTFKKQSVRNNVSGRLLTRINLLLLFVSLVAVTVFQLVDLPRIFVPLWPMVDNPYWFLSAAHLLDIVNQVILVAPLGVVGIIIYLSTCRTGGRTRTPEQALLAMLSVASFLVAFWLNPDLGYPRDWDLLSGFGFPFSLWGAYLAARGITGKPSAAGWLAAVVITTAAVLTPNLIEKNDLTKATERLDAALWLDAHYQTDYLSGRRCVPWGYILGKDVKDHERAQKYFARQSETGEYDDMTLTNLGEAFFFQGIYDSAYVYIKKALEMSPDKPVLNEHLAKAELELGLNEDALLHAEKAVRLDSNRPTALTQLGIVLSRLGRPDEAYVYFRRAYDLDPNSMEINVNLGMIMQQLKAPDSAYAYYMRGRELDPEMFMSNADMLYKVAIVEQELGKMSDALKHSQRAVELKPNDVKIQTQLGIIYYKALNKEKAAEHFRKAYRLSPDAYAQVLNLAMISSAFGLHDSAYFYLQKGLKLMGDSDSNISVTVALFNTCLILEKYDEARNALETLERMYPGSSEIAKLRARYENAVR